MFDCCKVLPVGKVIINVDFIVIDCSIVNEPTHFFGYDIVFVSYYTEIHWGGRGGKSRDDISS